MYGSVKVVFRDDTEKTYETYIGHLVKYERQYGSLTDENGNTSVESVAALAHLASESPLPLDEWLGGVKYVIAVTDQTDLGDTPANAEAASEPVPTQ